MGPLKITTKKRRGKTRGKKEKQYNKGLSCWSIQPNSWCQEQGWMTECFQFILEMCQSSPTSLRDVRQPTAKAFGEII